MKKVKIIFFVTITVILVVLCASLPKVTAMLVDKRLEEKTVYKAMYPIDMETKEGSTAFSMLEKLSIYTNGQSVSVKPANATKTEDEIKAAVESFLQQCQAAGIYQSFQPDSVTMSTKFVYDVADPSKSIVIWRYYAVKSEASKDSPVDGNELRTLDVIVDDDTGKILSVTFDHYGAGYAIDGLWERNRSRVTPLVELYFSQLDLLEKAEIAEASMGKLYQYSETDMGVTEVYYTIMDPACGSIEIAFVVGGVDTFRILVENRE